MKTENLLSLPPTIKYSAILILLISIFFSGGVTIYYIFWVDSQSNFILASLSVLQTSLTGAAAVLILFFSQRSLGRDALLRETTKWLTKDIPSSFETIDLPFSKKIVEWNENRQLSSKEKIEVKIDHYSKTNAAFYVVRAFNAGIFFRITLNSHRFIILYYIPKSGTITLDKVVSGAESVIAGAKLAGYDIRFREGGKEWGLEQEFYHMYLIKEVRRGFLGDSSERLFWSQDVSTMTRSLLLQLKRFGLITEDVGIE